ncbi:MAG: hypothetical protein R3300_18800, partial [Candidatus Promineifilaceae bacterium]|nr:hypothetical protein [Candidatus Promineifilaceae bacterium]
DMRSDDSPVTEGVQEEGQGQAESASLLEQAEAGSVPDWLRDAGGYAEHSAVADEEQAPETVTQSEDADEVPDWLKDEPDDDWLDQTLLDDSDTWSEPDYEEPADRAPEEMPTEGTGQEQPSEAYVPPGTEGLDLEAELATASAAGEPAPTPPEQRHSRSSTRTYEIILGVLIILAIAVVAALAYVILVPPF